MKVLFNIVLAGALQLSFAFSVATRQKQLTQHVKLNDYVSTVSAQNLNLSLDIESKGSHLHIRGMSWELQRDKVEINTIKMPGMHGPLPQLSSGIFPIRLDTPGTYIDLKGSQQVVLQDSSWELCWTDGIPSGSLMCGFTVPRDYTRNEASLLSGETYFITFTVFSREGLTELQTDKSRMMDEVHALMNTRQEAVDRMRSSFNPLVKAAEYSKAVDALERLSYYDTDRLNLIPSDKEVIAIGDSMMIANTGQVWSRGEDGKRVKHGTGFVSSSAKQMLRP